MESLKKIRDCAYKLDGSGGSKRSVALIGGITATVLIAALVLSARFSSGPQYDYLGDAFSVKEIGRQSCDWEESAGEGTELTRELQSIFLILLSKLEANEAASLSVKSPRSVLARTNCSASLRVLHSAVIFAELEVRATKIEFEINEDGDVAADYRLQSETRRVRYSKSRDGWVITAVLTDDAAADLSPTQGYHATEKRFVGFNYYPANAPWDRFWAVFPVSEVDADFQRISALGANSIRIFLNHSQFSDPAFAETAVERLITLLNLADKHGLKVVVTSFDLGVDYSPEAYSANWQSLSSVLRSVSHHPAFLLLDLKNEPDLDDDAWSKVVVDGFLLAMIASVRDEYPHIKITVGWSDPDSALRLADYLDVVTYHDYQDPDQTGERWRAIKASVPGKAVLITEIGETSWSPLSRSPRRQAQRLEDRLIGLAGADGVMLWTLNDFRHVPTSVVGWRPWRKRQQSLYGIFDRDGEPKPALAVVSDFFNAHPNHVSQNREADEEIL